MQFIKVGPKRKTEPAWEILQNYALFHKSRLFKSNNFNRLKFQITICILYTLPLLSTHFKIKYILSLYSSIFRVYTHKENIIQSLRLEWNAIAYKFLKHESFFLTCILVMHLTVQWTVNSLPFSFPQVRKSNLKRNDPT